MSHASAEFELMREVSMPKKEKRIIEMHYEAIADKLVDEPEKKK